MGRELHPRFNMNNLQVCRAVGHYKQRTVGDEPTQNRQLREVEMGLVDIGDDVRC